MLSGGTTGRSLIITLSSLAGAITCSSSLSRGFMIKPSWSTYQTYLQSGNLVIACLHSNHSCSRILGICRHRSRQPRRGKPRSLQKLVNYLPTAAVSGCVFVSCFCAYCILLSLIVCIYAPPNFVLSVLLREQLVVSPKEYVLAWPAVQCAAV